MKIKHLLLTYLFVTFAIFNSNAQSRENKEIVQFSSKSEKLTKAIGWKQDKVTGKWIENKNVIYDRKCPSYLVSHVSQNFKWLQFATILIGGQKYYILLYEQLGGEYKYPHIQEDWVEDLRTHYFILTPNEYENIKKQIDLKSGENIKITSKMSGYLSNRSNILGGEYSYNEENLLAKINNAIEKQGYSKTCFVLNAQVVDGQEVVRFRLPEEDLSLDKDCSFVERNFKTEYFEVNASDFKKILIE